MAEGGAVKKMERRKTKQKKKPKQNFTVVL